MPGLDALRGIAVLAVVFLHGLKLSQPVAKSSTHGVQIIVSLVTAGWLGVILFFVLSGFLITGILLDTRERANYWRSFYVRRMLRILPLYLVMLALLRFAFHFSWTYIGLCLIFLANMASSRMASYGPLWSLAVEEQFYLVWPFIVRRTTPRTLAFLCLGSILVSPFLRLLASHYTLSDPYVTTWCLTDTLSLGAFIALFLRSHHSSPKNVALLATSLAVLSAIIGVLCWHGNMLHRSSAAGRAFQTEPFLFLFGFILLLALRFGSHPWVLRICLPLRFYGYISYGLYLIHWLGFVLLNLLLDRTSQQRPLLTAPTLLGRFAILLGVMTLIAFLSRAYFEEPFLRLKDRLAPYRSAD